MTDIHRQKNARNALVFIAIVPKSRVALQLKLVASFIPHLNQEKSNACVEMQKSASAAQGTTV
jgi:hypothetical protein